jgi:nucleotide-binding universal stress UspA family protein
MAFKVLLWPSDASPSALEALQTAVEMAKTYQARLYALQVVNSVPMLSDDGFMPPAPMAFNVPKYEEELIMGAKKNLEKIIMENVPEGITVITEVRVGDPHQGIIDFVREKKIELIVMATHARKGMAHFFLGSVAEKVLRNSPVPVLAVPAAPAE